MTTEKKTAPEKPLDKMTVKELRELAKEMPEITGVHGMNKADLLSAIKEVKGIVETKAVKTDATVKEIKNQIKLLKVERATALEAKDKKMATIYRRQIARLKKRTRRSAA